jgi:TolB-like protein/Tfp pilus assembly protein PilF
LRSPKSPQKIARQVISAELERVLESPMFAQSDRLSRFLRFTVEKTLEGKADLLKEYLIGTEVYGRRPPYHPNDDSIVRSEARRLRAKLKEYYESIGKEDPLFIYYRPGSYVPVFRSRNHMGNEPQEPQEKDRAALHSAGSGIPVAVLPFTDLSQSPLSRVCAQGITDELLHELSRTQGIRVTAPSSVLPLLTQSFDVPALAQKLNVQIVFEGTVREGNRKLRITSRIVKADGFQLWSQRFETEPEPASLFAVSEQIASALISRTRPEISLIRKAKVSVGASVLAVYPLVLSAEAMLDEGTLAGTQAALAKFQEAAVLQTDYARPLCGVAQCYCELTLRGIPNSFRAIQQAKEAAIRAREIDPEMILVPSAIACSSALSWNWAESEEQFKEALRLGQHPGTLRQYALFLAALGRFDEAWEHARLAQQIDPFSHRQKVVYAKLFQLSRRYLEGIEHFSNRSLYGALPVDGELYLAFLLLSINRQEDARQLAESVRGKTGAQEPSLGLAAEILARCGDAAAARKIANDSHFFAEQSPLSKFRQSLLHVALGDLENAFLSLAKAHEEREGELIWLGHDPRLDELRNDQRYRSLLAEVFRKP